MIKKRARKTRRTRDYHCQTILDTLEFCYILDCSIVNDGIAVVESAAYLSSSNCFSNWNTPANTLKIADMVKKQRHVFDTCCLKLTFSANVTPRFNTQAAGVIPTQNMCREKSSSILSCVGVPMTINSILSALSFKLLFFIQRETSWRQSLSWFMGRQVYVVTKEI